MRDLAVIVPTKGRPDNAFAIAKAFGETRLANTELVLVVEQDEREAYSMGHADWIRIVEASPHPKRRGCVAPLNEVALQLLDEPEPPFAIGFMGDDHRPRTDGWDRRYVEALTELGTGLVYGDDLLRGPDLPTQVAMTSDIVAELGWMAPPDLRHLFVDDFWRELGKRAGCLTYLADVVVEHCHPVAGKAVTDDGYRVVNSSLMMALDAGAWFTIQRTGILAESVAKVRALREVSRG